MNPQQPNPPRSAVTSETKVPAGTAPAPAQGSLWSPQPGALDLWHLDLAGRAGAAAEASLTGQELARGRRLVVPQKQTQFFRTRAALRSVLSAVTGVEAAELVFAVGEHGKLSLSAGPDFNVSHSADLALIAVLGSDTSRQRGTMSLGVDVERVRLGRPLERMATRFFSPTEAEAFLALPAEQRPADFYRRWALKEAYLKALGTGLTYSSRGFVLRDDAVSWGPRPLLRHCSRHPDEVTRWQFLNGWIDRGGDLYAVAICVGRPRDLPGSQDFTEPRLRHFEYARG